MLNKILYRVGVSKCLKLCFSIYLFFIFSVFYQEGGNRLCITVSLKCFSNKQWRLEYEVRELRRSTTIVDTACKNKIKKVPSG